MMLTSPLNPDTRPLPSNWTEHFDAGRSIWYYQNNAAFPPRLSYVHPAGPLIPGADTQGHSQSAPARSFAQQLYASALGGSSGPVTSIPPLSSVNPNTHEGSRAPDMQLPGSMQAPTASRFTTTAGVIVSMGQQESPALASSSPVHYEHTRHVSPQMSVQRPLVASPAPQEASYATPLHTSASPSISSHPASSPPPPDVSRVPVQHTASPDNAPAYLDLRTPLTQTPSSPPPEWQSVCPGASDQEHFENRGNVEEEHDIGHLIRRPTLPLYSPTAEDGLSIDTDYANSWGPENVLDEGNSIVDAISQMSLSTEDESVGGISLKERNELRTVELTGRGYRDTMELAGEGDSYVPSVSRQNTPPVFPSDVLPGIPNATEQSAPRLRPLPSVIPVDSAAATNPTASSSLLIPNTARAPGQISSTVSSPLPARRLPSISGASAAAPIPGPGTRRVSGPRTLNAYAPTPAQPASHPVTPPLTSTGVPNSSSSQSMTSSQNLRNDASSTYARSLYASAFPSSVQARPRTAGSASSATSTPLTSPSPSVVTHPRGHSLSLPQTAVEADTVSSGWAGTHVHAHSASFSPPPLPQRRSASTTAVPIASTQPQPQPQPQAGYVPQGQSEAQFPAQTQSASSYRYSIAVSSPSSQSTTSTSSGSSGSLLSSFWGISRAQRKEEKRRLERERIEREKAREEREKAMREGQIAREQAERRRVPPPFVPRVSSVEGAPMSLYGSGVPVQLSAQASAAGEASPVHGIQNYTAAQPSPQSQQSLSPVSPPIQYSQQQQPTQQSSPQQQYLQQNQYSQQYQSQQQQQQRGFRDTLLSTVSGHNMSSAVAGGVAGMVGGALLGAVAVAEGQDLMSGISNGLGQVMNGVDLGQLSNGMDLGQLTNGVDLGQLTNGIDLGQLTNGVDLGQFTNGVDFSGLADPVYGNDDTGMNGNAFDPTDGTFNPFNPTDGTFDFTSGASDFTNGTYDPTDGAYDPTDGVYNSSDGQYDPASGTYNPTDGTYNPTNGTYDPTNGTYDPADGSYDPTDGAYDPTNGTFDPTDSTYDPNVPYAFTDGSYDPADDSYNPADGADDPTDGSNDPSASSPQQGQNDAPGQQQQNGQDQSQQQQDGQNTDQQQQDPEQQQLNALQHALQEQAKQEAKLLKLLQQQAHATQQQQQAHAAQQQHQQQHQQHQHQHQQAHAVQQQQQQPTHVTQQQPHQQIHTTQQQQVHAAHLQQQPAHATHQPQQVHIAQQQQQTHATQQQTQQQIHAAHQQQQAHATQQQQAHAAHLQQQPSHSTHQPQQVHNSQQQAHMAHQQQQHTHATQQQTQQQTHAAQQQQQAHVAQQQQPAHATHQQGTQFQQQIQQQLHQQVLLQKMLQTQLQQHLQQQNYVQAQATASLLANVQNMQQQLLLQAGLVGAGADEAGGGPTISSQQGGASGSALGSTGVSSMGSNVHPHPHASQIHPQLAAIGGTQQHAGSHQTIASGPGHLNAPGQLHTQNGVGLRPSSFSVDPSSYLHHYQQQLQNANQATHTQNLLQLAQLQRPTQQPQNAQLLQLAQLPQLAQRPPNAQLQQLSQIQLTQLSQNAPIHQLQQATTHTHTNSLGLSASTQQQLGRLAVNGALRVGGMLLSNALTGNTANNGVGTS